MLIDEVVITVKAGDGGDGAVSFRREKYVPRGGPDGGDGGKGGDVGVIAAGSTHGLANFRGQKDYKALPGARGGRAKRHGANASDLILYVPVGTRITELIDKTGRQLADLVKEDELIIVARGGKGGKGNWHFRSATHQTPREFEYGIRGQFKTLKLELQLIADVGLIGLPNAGKSTLLSVISNARPKVADYPFTTLEPNLGMVNHRGQQFVVADIPGLIAGAASGKGLGIEFLKHVERTRVLVHLIPATAIDPEQVYKTIHQELKAFDPRLLEKSEIVVLSKVDLDSQWQKNHAQFIKKHKVMGISAATNLKVDQLLDLIAAKLAG